MQWFDQTLKKLFKEETVISKGIPLQICDIFLQELNNVDGKGISFKNIADILEPFLNTLANSRNSILVHRIKEKVFLPMLENNITPEVEEEEEDKEEETK